MGNSPQAGYGRRDRAIARITAEIKREKQENQKIDVSYIKRIVDAEITAGNLTVEDASAAFGNGDININKRVEHYVNKTMIAEEQQHQFIMLIGGAIVVLGTAFFAFSPWTIPVVISWLNTTANS